MYDELDDELDEMLDLIIVTIEIALGLELLYADIDVDDELEVEVLDENEPIEVYADFDEIEVDDDIYVIEIGMIGLEIDETELDELWKYVIKLMVAVDLLVLLDDNAVILVIDIVYTNSILQIYLK